MRASSKTYTKTFSAFLVIILIGGLAWLINKNYFKQPQPQSSSYQQATDRNNFPESALYYAQKGKYFDIYRWQAGKAKKVYTDADEAEKITKLGNLTSSGEVFAIVGTGKLVAINLGSATRKVLQENFSSPLFWRISPSGKIAFTKFSNLEDNYGYTLYAESSDGTGKKSLVRSESQINSFSWDPGSTKIAYGEISGIKTDIKIFDTATGTDKLLISFENEVVDSISWPESQKLIISHHKLTDKNNSKIEEIPLKTANSSEITQASGGIANFLFANNDFSWLGYLVAQYKDAVSDTTSGQIYIFPVTNSKEKISIEKGTQILGWL